MTERTGFVYWILAGEFVKIGFSQKPYARIADLQTANGHQLRLLLTVPGTHADEQAAHAKFNRKRVAGEWFTFDDEMRVEAIRLGAKLDAPTGLLTLAEAAKALRHSESWLRRAARAGVVRAYRVGGAVMFKVDELEAYVDGGRLKPKQKRYGKPPASSAVLEDLKSLVS